MDEEIEFRGLNADNEWVYGLITKDAPNSTVYYNDYSYRIHWIDDDGAQCNMPVKNGTVCRYIGIRDKNDVKIYEGHKLINSDKMADEIAYNVVLPVKYANNKGFQMYVRGIGYYPIYSHFVEIVGDVFHDNRE